MSNVLELTEGNVRVIQLDHKNKHNPFNAALEEAIKEALSRAQSDDDVKALVVTGGIDRSFSCGGDFNEVKNLSGGDDVDAWIDRVIDLYMSALKVDKPTVAAIDGYAIGMGFQFAQMFDWRVMSSSGCFRMPELKHGIGCSVGASILSSVLTLNATREIVFGCADIDAQKALQLQLVNEVVAQDDLLPRSIEVAAAFADYPRAAFRNTKISMHKTLMKNLQETSDASKIVHRAAFSERSAQTHFRKILGSKY